jgi:tetratricopeptide (TPR) repeat protein
VILSDMTTKKIYILPLFIWGLAGLFGCGWNSAAGPQPTEAVKAETEIKPTATVTPVPTVEQVATCADIDAYWGNDWPAVLKTLDQLIAADQTCGDEPLLSKKYAVHYNYAAVLENEGERSRAIEQYQAALMIDPQRQEALNALIRLEALPKPTPPACLSTSAPRPDPAPAEASDTSLFIKAEADQLRLNGEPFKVKGVNYYPRQAPWQRFLQEADPIQMTEELDVIKEAGLNTIRVFLWYEPLFTCQPEDAIPNEDAFVLLDTLFELANARDLKVIMTLNDLPDLVFRPLYTDWAHYDAQTIYVVRRYRNEPNLLAWDLRNEGDLDYGAQPGREADFSRTEVLDWLAHLSELVREHDPYHLLTAGWWGDPTATEPYVDILSFHHWTSAAALQKRIADYQPRTDKPLMLQEVGYHSWAESPDEPRGEAKQAETLAEVIDVVEKENLSGWVIWTAFDFVPASGQPLNNEHFFGLWRTDLSPKPVVDTLPLQP